MPGSYSERLATWIDEVRFNDLPDYVVSDAKLRILDIVGTTLAASSFDASKSIREGALRTCAGDEATILGHGERASTAGAALANGTMAHALDYDDTHFGAVVHISAPTVTTALAIGETLGASGKDVLTAIVAGAEIGCRIGSVAPKAFHQQGFHATSVVGVFAAAATAGKLLGLDATQLSHALGIAGSQSSGIMQCFNDGTWTKQLHVGWATHAAIIGSNLAASGFTGPSEVLEGIQGFFKTHAKPGQRFLNRMTDDLGERWEYPTTSFKPYPCGHVVHGFLDCIMQLYGKGLRAEQIKSITCPIAEWMIPIMCEPREVKLRPASDYHAKFSFPFTIAATLTFGRLGVEAFSEQNINNPEILALTEKIIHVPDPTATDPSRFKGWVQVETIDGRELDCVVTDNWGSKHNPMTPEQLYGKFQENSSLLLPDANVQLLSDEISYLEQIGDVSKLAELCVTS